MEESSLVTKKFSDIVVYYWGTLALNQSDNISDLEEQKCTFNQWLQQQIGLNSALIVKAIFTDNHLKKSKPKYFPELSKAVDYCVHNNCMLVIVKLNGLISRNEFFNFLATKDLDFYCIDKPLINKDALPIIRQYVHEQSKQHGVSIKRGLKQTNQKLGNPEAHKAIAPFNKIKTENSVFFSLLLQPVLAKYQQQGYAQRKIVDELNKAGILAPEGGKWVLSQLQKILKRIETNNLALELFSQIKKNNYKDYSAADLISAFNQNKLSLSGKSVLDEETIDSLNDRLNTINKVLELYNLMQDWSYKILAYISEGKTLEEIATILNEDQVKVPIELDDNVPQQDLLWDSSNLAELVKRMNHRLNFKYNPEVKAKILLDLNNYISYANNTLPVEMAEIISNLYKNPVFAKIII